MNESLAGGNAAPPTSQAPYTAEDVAPEPMPEGTLRLPSGVGLPTAKAVVDIWDRCAGPVPHGPLRHRGGDWFEYRAGVYREVPKQRVRDNVYRLVDKAVYWKEPTSKDDGEWVPWGATRPRVTDVLDALATAAGLPHDLVAGQMLDGTPAPPLLNVRNGLLDLTTGVLHPHNPQLFTTSQVAVWFDPTAPAPLRWLQFLHDTFGGDQTAVAAVQQWAGYVLSGRTHLQRALFIRGERRSGKGTIARILTQLVGAENVAAPTASAFSTNFGLMSLIGRTLAITGDLRAKPGGQEELVERILSITGEDTITLDRKNKDPWSGRIGARLMFLSNDPPGVVDSSGALASRFLLLETQGSWLGQEDLDLERALLAEMPGILTWALAGYAHIAAGGRIVEPATSAALREDVDELGSAEAAFLKECCTIAPEAEEDLALLHVVYRGWRTSQGQKEGKAKRRFAADLRARLGGRPPSRPSNGRYYQPGVLVADDLPDDVRRAVQGLLDVGSPLRLDPRIQPSGGFGALQVVR